jgi:hypothetical protein
MTVPEIFRGRQGIFGGWESTTVLSHICHGPATDQSSKNAEEADG